MGLQIRQKLSSLGPILASPLFENAIDAPKPTGILNAAKELRPALLIWNDQRLASKPPSMPIKSPVPPP